MYPLSGMLAPLTRRTARKIINPTNLARAEIVRLQGELKATGERLFNVNAMTADIEAVITRYREPVNA